MKKCLSVLLVLSLVLATCLALGSCKHKCKPGSNWSRDAEYHWHACTVRGCDKSTDKEKHDWGAGFVTDKPTQDKDGAMRFICGVCSETKTERIGFIGFSKEEWDATLDISVFDNFSYKESAVTDGSGVSVTSEVAYKFTEDSAWISMAVAGQTREDYTPNAEVANQLRTQLVRSIKELLPYECFAYDSRTKSYFAISNVYIAALDAYTSDVIVKFSDGRLTEIKYTAQVVQKGVLITATATVTLSDYGEVVIDLPS